MIERPLVSVIIPVYNAGALLAETLESVLTQTYPRTEVIVVDDGSSDEDTLAVLERYRHSIRLLRQPNLGVGSARNAGLAASTGDYVAFVDHDDVWAPETLAIQIQVALRFPDSGMIVANGIQVHGATILAPRLISEPFWRRLVAANGEPVTGAFFEDVVEWNPAACPAQVLIPRSVCDQIGPISVDRREAEDLEYALRIAAAYPITLHRESLVRWRYLSSSRSGPLQRRRFVWADSHTRVLKRHHRLARGHQRRQIAVGLNGVARRTAVACYDYVRAYPEDASFARRFLLRYMRLHPRPFTLLCLAALWAPERIATPLARAYRGRVATS